MAPATRQMTGGAVYAHLLDNVLLLPQGHPIRLSFAQQGYESADDLLCIFENELETLEYIPLASADGPETTAPIIRHFLRWQASLERQKGTPLKNSELAALNNEDFVLYRRSALGQVSSTVAPIVTNPNAAIPTAKTLSAVEDFKRGIKRDKTHYPVLKDDRYWDNFYRSFVVTAVSHNVEKVLDPSYLPTDPLEKSLFEEQNKFVYSALEHTLQTDMGKNIVREHSFDFNAQEVFRKVVKHYTESASAKISSSTTLGYLTMAKYSSSWTGTAEGFILHWKNHLRIYNDTVPTDVESSGGECGGAAVVTELANGNEGVESKAGKDVGLASCRGKTREVESGRVAGREGSAVGNTDREWRGGRLAVEVGAGHGDVVSCATGVGNGRGHGTRRGGDYRQIKHSNMIY